MTRLFLLGAMGALAALLFSGCVAAFTSIRKADDNSYYVTEHKAGGFTHRGRVYKCTPSGDVMNCAEIEVDW